MEIKKIYEDDQLQLYYFKVQNNTKYLNDVINVSDDNRVITYDDTIISEEGKICQFFYMPKETKNSVFILYDLLPFRIKNFVVLKKKGSESYEKNRN